MSGAEPFLMAAGTVFQVVGQLQQSNAAEAEAKRSAQIAERNAELARQDRALAMRTAELAAADRAREQRRQLAEIRASMGASGLEFSGSPVDLLWDTSIEQALDVKRTMFEGDVRGREGSIEVLNYQEQASADRARAKSIRSSKYTSAGATLLSGGSRAYSSFEENGYI